MSDNTVFISYRRSVSAFIARAVFQDLRYHEFDVFMDVESIDAGAFDAVILNQIAARSAPGDFRGANADYYKYLDLGGGQQFGNQAEVEETMRNLEKRWQC